MRLEAKHQYFKRLCSQMNWLGNVPRTMAQRHSRYSALQFYLVKLKPASDSAVVVLGSVIYLLMSSCEVASRLFQLPAIMDRVGSYTGDVTVAQHTKWKYCNQLIENGTVMLFKNSARQVCVALIQQLFEVSGLFIITYRQFKSQLVIHNHRKMLPDMSLLDEECAMELNTNQMTIAHKCLIDGKCYVLHT